MRLMQLYTITSYFKGYHTRNYYNNVKFICILNQVQFQLLGEYINQTSYVEACLVTGAGSYACAGLQATVITPFSYQLSSQIE